MKKLELQKILDFCSFYNLDGIKTEINTYIEGFVINRVKIINQGKDVSYKCFFIDKDGNKLVLIISLDRIQAFKQDENFAEYITIKNDLNLRKYYVERRPDGLLYSLTNKQFTYNHLFDKKVVLSELNEDSFVFGKQSLYKLINNNSFSQVKMFNFIIKMVNFTTNDLINGADYHYSFNSRMKILIPSSDFRLYTYDIYPTKTCVNGEDVSHLYDLVDGFDKINRIYNLYKGIINKENETDINCINIGLLSSCSYDLKSLMEITKKEESLIGKSINIDMSKYYEYLKSLFKTKYNYEGDLSLDRDSIIKAITYQKYCPSVKEDSLEEITKAKKKKKSNIIKRLFRF